MPEHALTVSMTTFPDISLDAMVSSYRKIRIAVHDRATEPVQPDVGAHARNQELLKEKMLQTCTEASLDRYRDPGHLWEKMWRVIRYAGFKASIASVEISHLAPHFDDFNRFIGAEWDPPEGSAYKEFLSPQSQRFPERRVRNRHKLRKTVNVARLLAAHCQKHVGAEQDAMRFITGDADRAVWRTIHARLLDLGYTADLTALHLMMDTGFHVVKPDIVLTRLMLAWGWLHASVGAEGHPPLPTNMTLRDIQTKSGLQYTRSNMYSRVIDLAVRIAARLDKLKSELEGDIGWVSDNSLRELDLFIVKYGQEPDSTWGVARNLAASEVPDWPMTVARGRRP